MTDQVFTVNVSGAERHDGEKPYTYVLHAESMVAAKRAAWLHHVATESKDITPERVAEDPFLYGPNDVVIIDCPTFPCFQGPPPWGPDAPGGYWNDLRNTTVVVDEGWLASIGYDTANIREENDW